MVQPKSCPFCGGPVSIHRDHSEFWFNCHRIDCAARIRFADQYVDGEEETTKRFNRRAGDRLNLLLTKDAG